MADEDMPTPPSKRNDDHVRENRASTPTAATSIAPRRRKPTAVESSKRRVADQFIAPSRSSPSEPVQKQSMKRRTSEVRRQEVTAGIERLSNEESESPTRIIPAEETERRKTHIPAKNSTRIALERGEQDEDDIVGVIGEDVDEYPSGPQGDEGMDADNDSVVDKPLVNRHRVADTQDKHGGANSSEIEPYTEGKDDAVQNDDDGEVSQDVTKVGSGDVGSTQIDLRALLKKQELTLKSRNNELFHERADIFRSPRTRGDVTALLNIHSLQAKMDEEADGPQTPERLWNKMVDLALARDPGFFTSDEARMKESRRCVGKGSAAYSGLKVNRYNCVDLNEIYALRYRTKELMNMASGSSFKLLQSVVGQFLRWCISAKRLERREGWKEKALFRQLAKEDLVQVFVNHFITGASSSTVASKCNALHIVTKYATLKFNDDSTRLRIARVALYLTSTFNAAKSKYREDARQKQNADDRVKEHKIVTSEQTKKGIRLAKAVMDDIIDSYHVRLAEEGQKGALRWLVKTQGLIQKWGLNFLALLTLTGGGQRPQAYARLQCPSRKVLDTVYEKVQVAEEAITVKTFKEKTARALDIPGVVFPIMVLPYIAFHVDVVRRILIHRRREKPSEIFLKNQPLLLHTRSGEYMTPSNVSHSIRTFMRGVDPRLTNVTAMTLRASYATSMLHNYRQGRFSTKNLTEEEFLALIAKQMNTSVEQLRGTYIAAYSKDFAQTMKLFTKHFSIVMNEKNDDVEGSAEDKGVGEDRGPQDDGRRMKVPRRLVMSEDDSESDGELLTPERKKRRKLRRNSQSSSRKPVRSASEDESVDQRAFSDEEEDEEEDMLE